MFKSLTVLASAVFLFSFLVACGGGGSSGSNDPQPPPHAVGQAVEDEPASQIDALFRSYIDDSSPGASVILMKDGVVVLRSGYGLANLEHRVASSPETVYRIGSITKQFTAAAIMQLADAGKLSIDDEITKFLPDYPVHGHSITIKHLLTHTSGIRNYTSIPGWRSEGRNRQDLELSELIDIFKSLPMDFAPGDEHGYSSSGYALLGAIIEAVSGESYAVYLQNQITQPLELANTRYDDRTIVPNRATGYTVENGVVIRAAFVSTTVPYAAGMLISTVDDLASWTASLAGGKVIDQESYAAMVAPAVLNNGSVYSYGFGLRMDKVRGRDALSHGGDIPGFSAFAIHVPGEDIIAVVLSNNNSLQPHPMTLAKKAVAILLGDPYQD